MCVIYENLDRLEINVSLLCNMLELIYWFKVFFLLKNLGIFSMWSETLFMQK